MSALLHLFRLLPDRDRLAAACVCKEWNAVSKHPSLWAKLDLQNNQQASKVLSNLPHQYTGPLKEVNLEFAADVTDQDLRKLHGNSLEILNLNACQRVTDAGVIMLVAQSPNLRQLSLYWNVHITDTPLYKVAALCNQLTHLNLSGCKRVTDEGLTAVAGKCHRLVDVDLTRCMEVTVKGYIAIATGCRQLQTLRMYACANVNDAVLQACGQLLPELRVLDICGAHMATDEGAKALARCHKLEVINFTWCVQLTDEGVTPVAAGCPNLKSLSLHGLRGITNCTVEALAKHCRDSLHTLDVHGCIGIKAGDSSVWAYLQRQLPLVQQFVIHT
ncbi:hypothetical protein ABBQ32_004985 [Trebouxia sp. C0010 RCD-2024]